MKALAIKTTLITSLLTACTTASFAPPATRVGHVLSRVGADACDLSQIADNKEGNKRKIKRNASGALKLVNNFILTYRCSARSAANGKRYFQIPSFLSAVGGATAAALGAGPNVAIAAGASAATFNGANGYFAPKEKAFILNSALDALICIKSEAVGISSFSTQANETDENDGDNKSPEKLRAARTSADDQESGDEDGKVSFSSERRYFEMIGAALYSVERVTADRMSSVGSLDAAGMVKEIEDLANKVKAAKEEEDKQQVDESGNKDPNGGAADAEKALAESVASKDAVTTDLLKARVNFNTELQLNTLQPKLQMCVLRAKL